MSTLPSDRFDVIIVGAGAAGVTAAIALGRAGFSVLLCEAGIFPGAENWSGAVYFTENLEHPEAFGSQTIESAPYERRLVERGAYLYNGHGLVGASLRSPDVFRSCYTVLRPVYDRYLAEVAREHGVLLANETTVQSLIRHGGRVVGVHTERGPAYADVVFLAEGDASHLVTQEGYERAPQEDAPEGSPHFLQGVKEVISLPADVLEQRFGLKPGEGAAYEMLLRNASRKGRTVHLNMGGFLYTNRDSISLGFVLPLDNLRDHFQGDHNLLMEWFKGLPEVARLIDGGSLTSYGAKIIRGGGFRETPQLVDDGLAIGGAATGVGLDFPYPNFTGPATAMGLYFAHAVRAIAAGSGGPGRTDGPTDSPYTREALERTYLQTLRASHYWRNVEYLKDWPAYVERTRWFFDRQLDLLNNVVYIQSRRDVGALRRWWETVRVLRRVVPLRRLGEVSGELRRLGSTVGVGRLIRSAITPGTVARVVWNTVGALLPLGRKGRVGAADPDGAVAGAAVAEATSHDGARMRAVFRVLAGEEDPGRMPLWFRWIWRRYGPAVASAFSEVYTNDDTDVSDKLAASARHVAGAFSIWDLALELLGVVAYWACAAVQAGLDWYRHSVLRWDLSRFLEQLGNRLLEDNRERIRLDESRVQVTTTYEAKLGTITYHEGRHSHIKVLWPEDLANRSSLSDSPLWNVCPAKVYEVRRNPAGAPGVVVNFDNCIKCETCWRATGDVHWSRATTQRLVYQTYTPTQAELHEYLESRPEPHPLVRDRPAFWERLLADIAFPGLESGAAAVLATVQSSIARVKVGLRAYSDDLARSPLALEEARREHLTQLVDIAAAAFEHARRAWDSEALAELRSAAPEAVTELWDDAAQRFVDMQRHARGNRFFWARVLAEQVRDHHFAGLERFCAPLAEGAEISVQDIEDPAPADWSQALEWRAREGAAGLLDGVRERIAGGAEELFDSRALRRLEHREEPSDDQIGWLREQVAAALVAGRSQGYGHRDVLLEELAGRDPSLAWLAASHMLAADLLEGTGHPRAAALREGKRWAAAVVDGHRELGGDRGSTLTVSADFVPAALADTLVVVVSGKACVVDVDDPAVRLRDVGAVGLIGAGIRRAEISGIDLDEDAMVAVGERLDEVDLASPAAGEPHAGVLGLGVADYLAVVRGAGEYLLGRARDHAAGRVQFPGTFQDEAGRDTIAKFGAVKQMLAEMEARRFALDAAVLANPCAPDDPWCGLAVIKVLASEAFGPGAGSFTYETGQLFGGTAFSEDDVIAKYYRDSAPFRFLLGHDDALRAEIGRRRLRAVRAGGRLVPFSEDDGRALEESTAHELLADAAARFREAVAGVEEWARAAGDADDDGVAWLAGSAVVSACRVKICLLRAIWRIDAGIPTEAILEAVRLLADRFHAEAPALSDEAELLADTVAVGESLIAEGDPFPGPRIAGAEPYTTLIEHDRAHESGEWLLGRFDPEHLRYVPEILGNDDRLLGYWNRLEGEFRERYVEPRFGDGLIYGRHLEELHRIPQEDLDYMVERGFMRMPIAGELGGEGALKAEYYILCKLIGRCGDAALSLAIMANTSIGTTPTLIGLYQDLPRAREELERVRHNPEVLGEISDGIDRILGMLARPDLDALTEAYKEVMGTVRKRVGKSMVLKYIGGGFLRAFYAAGTAGQQRDLARFGDKLREARELLDGILEGVDERLAEYPRRQRAHELFLRMISAGYVSAFALTEPTAGSDSGGVKTQGRLESRRVHRDDDGVLYFWLDEQGRTQRRNLLDADRLEFDYAGHRLLYRYADDAAPAVIDHSEYDYEKDDPGRTRSYMHGDRKVAFTDIAQLREGADGPVYEYWVLNGAKMWITNGRFSHCMALYARTEPEGVTGFMVDRHAEGMVVGADEEKLGQRGSPTNELSLNNVRVPREMIIGFRGRGQVNALETLNTGRAGLAVTTHSTIQEMVEDALPYTRGESSSRFPYAARKRQRPLERYWMGRLAEELVGTAATTFELVGLLDNEKTASVRMESAIGKYYGSEAEHDAIDWMERLRGLEGQTWVHRIEKTRRDARVLNIYEGTNEVQRFLLLKDLVQRVLPGWRGADIQRLLPLAEGLAEGELVHRLEQAKARLIEDLAKAVERFGQQVWANVALQPCFFRLSEIAGLTKVIDALLYRLEWLSRCGAPTDYAERVRRAGRLYARRALSRIAVLERRYRTAYDYLESNRYAPETQLGFLSLEEEGAVTEGLGRLPERLRVSPPGAALRRDVEIAVLLKPVPMAAPRPRLGESGFVEPYVTLGEADDAALRAALRLKRRDRERIRITAYSVAGGDARPVLRLALARGVDTAVHVAVASGDGSGSPEHDARYVARALAGALRRRPADLVLCGDSAADTGQGVLATYMGAQLEAAVYSEVDSLDWVDDQADGVRVRATAWQGRTLDQDLPCVIAVAPSEGSAESFDLAAYLRATRSEIQEIHADSLVSDLVPLKIRHIPRTLAGGDGAGQLARDPEAAAAVLARLVEGAGAATDDAAEPYAERMLTLGEQPAEEDATCLLLAEPAAAGSMPASLRGDMEAAAALAGGVGLPLDVIVPMEGDEGQAARLAGSVIAAGEPRRVYVVRHDGLCRFGAAGHLEWLQEFWAMYRGQPRWLLGPASARELLGRFVAHGVPGLDGSRCWSWYGVDTIGNGGGAIRVATGVYGGAAMAEASLPADGGLRVVTLGRSPRVELGDRTYAMPGTGNAAVFLWSPALSYDPAEDPVACLVGETGAGEPTLEDAEFIIDVGYGAGGHDGIDRLVEPLRALLAEELGLPKVMIGATRKVTQDLELLPMDRQIGQTGVSVNPKLIIALAVSGAPQHIDYVGERATILSFNIDAEAPLMKLNEQRAKPVVHPIVGDVWETIPAFIEAVRKKVRGG